MNDISDAGGVAARVGFKYQDHVAANLVLKMIDDRRVVQVECETSDDITVVAIRNGIACPEYIQVKTTDKDTKWTSTELTSREVKGKPTSIIEKSLLCDKHGPQATFRIVARRPVNKGLIALMDPLDQRSEDGPIAVLAASWKKKHSGTTSSNGHDLDYWTRNTVWEVFSGIDTIENKNLQLISRLAEDQGANPTFSHTKTIYRTLLEIVDAAALATRRNPALKIISRAAALKWWQDHIQGVATAQRASAKPYRTRGERFFVQIHKFEHDSPRRQSSGYDAQFERKVWRSEQLANYLRDWIPEVTLRASELVEIDQLNLREKLEASLKRIQASGDVDGNKLLAETLLHAVLRHWFSSEPIACKLYHRSSLGDRITRNAHVVHDPSGDQLWLGRAHLLDGTDRTQLIKSIRQELQTAMETEVLAEERDVILQLREPQHLTSNTLSDALARGSPVDELIKVLCLPILVAYDSDVLSLGHKDDYDQDLAKETLAIAEDCLSALPADLNEVQIHVFLVPVERLELLSKSFSALVGLA